MSSVKHSAQSNPDQGHFGQKKSISEAPNFNSELVERAFTRNVKFFDKASQSADKIRDDFRNLQAELQKRNVNTTFSYKMSQSCLNYAENESWIVMEGLAWIKRDEKPHQIYHFRFSFQGNPKSVYRAPENFENARVITTKEEDGKFRTEVGIWIKPILECSFEIRQRCYPFLDKFIEGLGEQLKGLFVAPDDSDEIPF